MVQLLSIFRLFSTAWTAARQASLSFTIYRHLLKLMFIELVMPFLILWLRESYFLCPQPTFCRFVHLGSSCRVICILRNLIFGAAYGQQQTCPSFSSLSDEHTYDLWTPCSQLIGLFIRPTYAQLRLLRPSPASLGRKPPSPHPAHLDPDPLTPRTLSSLFPSFVLRQP